MAHEPHGILRSNELSVGELVGCREWSDDVSIHVVHITCSFQRCRNGHPNRGEFGVLVAWKVVSILEDDRDAVVQDLTMSIWL